MDLQYTTDTHVVRDYSWLDPQSPIETAQPRTLLIAGATEATHYPDGFLKSGTIMAKYTSGGNAGFWAPYVVDHVGGFGLNTQVGIVLDGFEMRRGSSGAIIGIEVFGSMLIADTPIMVYVSKLPGLLNNAAGAYTPLTADLPSGFTDLDAL
jgi:hypothetical protein